MFQSDFAAKRTWDPDTGWELHETGYARFELKKPGRKTIYFWGQWLSVENIEGVTPLGHRRCRQVFDVRAVNAWPGARASPEEKHLIADALVAYGGLHNGPLGPVDVLFAE